MGQGCASSDFFEVLEVIVILCLLQYLINVHALGGIHLHEMLLSTFFDLLAFTVHLLWFFVQHLNILVDVLFASRREEILMLIQQLGIY